ncbi:zeta toxin family protein (plasmid) [Embleya sp. NBC_00888]|uniref:zeta toxin family protein n=1 Tax=Embleya sp. NBC_00888 TaxID=2975960 RepID=UPI002F915DA7|nr:zeta toxin family protein [Embleya sp. NBC_00888]
MLDAPGRFLLNGRGPREQALFDRAFRDELVPRFLPEVAGPGVARPQAWFLIGQPGAGKTTLAEEIAARLDADGGCDRVDADRYYAIHPNFEAARALGPTGPASELMPDIQDMRDRVMALLADRHRRGVGRHVLMETTARLDRDFELPARTLRRDGMGHEIVGAMIAAPAAVSAHAVLTRFVAGGHLVASDDHDRSVEAQFTAAGIIDDPELVDRGLMYVRATNSAMRGFDLIHAQDRSGDHRRAMTDRLIDVHLQEMTHRDLLRFTVELGVAHMQAGSALDEPVARVYERVAHLVPEELKPAVELMARQATLFRKPEGGLLVRTPRRQPATHESAPSREDPGPTSAPAGQTRPPRPAAVRTSTPDSATAAREPGVRPVIKGASVPEGAIAVARERGIRTPVSGPTADPVLTRLLARSFGPAHPKGVAGAEPTLPSPGIPATFRSPQRAPAEGPAPSAERDLGP